MTARSVWLAAATGVAGVAVGWLLAPAATVPSGPAAAGPVAQSASPQADPVISPPAISLDDVRRVVREELAADDARSAPAPHGPEPLAGDSDPPSPAQTAALARAGLVLDGAASRRQFTDADVDALRAEFRQLSAEQQVEIMRRYAMAVNQGRIVPQSDRLPF
jgi:hypothetical protein